MIDIGHIVRQLDLFLQLFNFQFGALINFLAPLHKFRKESFVQVEYFFNYRLLDLILTWHSVAKFRIFLLVQPILNLFYILLFVLHHFYLFRLLLLLFSLLFSFRFWGLFLVLRLVKHTLIVSIIIRPVFKFYTYFWVGHRLLKVYFLNWQRRNYWLVIILLFLLLLIFSLISKQLFPCILITPALILI